jgi:hypothetical protein
MELLAEREVGAKSLSGVAETTGIALKQDINPLGRAGSQSGREKGREDRRTGKLRKWSLPCLRTTLSGSVIITRIIT